MFSQTKEDAMKRNLTQEEYLQEQKAPKRTDLQKFMGCRGIIDIRSEERHSLHQGDNSPGPVIGF